MNNEPATYHHLVSETGSLLQKGRERAAKAVNTILLQTYCLISRHIVEFEQGGKEKAGYGSNLLDRLSKDLTQRYGKGFSRSNLSYIRRFYIYFPNFQTSFLSSELIRETPSHELHGQKSETLYHKLTWSHYFEILKSDSELEIGFCARQADKKELEDELNKLLDEK